MAIARGSGGSAKPPSMMRAVLIDPSRLRRLGLPAVPQIM